MSKYYTPEIEEFHVGFECEVVQEAKWVKVEVIDSNMGYFERRLNEGESARVKYLDREDVEDILSSNNINYKIGRQGLPMSGYNGWTEYEITLDGDFKYFRMIYADEARNLLIESNFNMVFNGRVKNKSELGRVLKMVGVI
jgi:hypothetical protein